MILNGLYSRLKVKEKLKYRGEPMSVEEIKARANRQGRNELCACGSGKKYKKCCGREL